MRHFKRTSQALKGLAFGILFIMLVPQFAAATDSQVSTTTTIDIDSEHQDIADEVVNAGNSSGAQNPSTWNPTYQGIWIGSSTKESLYQFNDITSISPFVLSGVTIIDHSRLLLASEFVFSQHSIMTGCSDFVVRMPVFVDSSAMSYAGLTILQLDDSAHYYFQAPLTLAGLASTTLSEGLLWTYITNGTGRTIFSDNYDISDTLVTDGDSQWVKDDRSYLEVHAPIIPSTRYLFIWYGGYDEEQSFKVYLAPDDIANDGIQNSSIARYTSNLIHGSGWSVLNETLELGWSFDFRMGLGNGVTAFDVWLNKDDKVYICLQFAPMSATGYPLLNIPFYTLNGSASFNISAESLGGVSWTRAAHIYNGSILASSAGSIPGNSTNPWSILLVSQWPQLVRFYFVDATHISYAYFPHVQICNSTATLGWKGYTPLIESFWFDILGSLTVVTVEIPPPDFASTTPIPITPQSNEPQVDWSGVLGTIILGIGLVLTIALPPLGAVIVGGVLYGAGLGLWINELANSHSVVADTVRGFFRNVIDAIYNTLILIGHFVWSVFEGIWEVITAVVNALIEYGSILLGLLIVGVAMLLYFYPVHYAIRIGTAFYLMAQGKLEQGANLGYKTGKDVVSDFTGALGGPGKKAGGFLRRLK
jgi:hypothetical protein